MKYRFLLPWLLAWPVHAQQPIESGDILAYLDQVIEWQRSAAAVETTGHNAREIVFRDTLRQHASKVLRYNFDFAELEAGVQPSQNDTVAETDTPQDATPQQKLALAVQENNRTIAQLQSTVKTQPSNQSARDQLQLQLARRDMLANAKTTIAAMSSSNASDSLSAKLDNLARTIPELNDTVTTEPAKSATTKRPVASIMSLTIALYDIVRKTRELEEVRDKAGELRTRSRELLEQQRLLLEQEIRPDNGGADIPITQRVRHYKQLAQATLPLAQATIFTTSSRTALKDWQALLDAQFAGLLRQLGIHLAILAATLAVPLILSHVAHRAIERYTSDPKRQRQLNIARRIITGIVVVFILMLNFISDFSSFATFAGFLTAGLAVALQSVLLSLVAHFFFYGRYGVRAGDRVHVAGVTGDIIQIGMVRFHLRELQETDEGMQPTGKIVAFPNAILFQNVAFYKFIAS